LLQADGRTDRQTDMTKLTVAFRNLATRLKMGRRLWGDTGLYAGDGGFRESCAGTLRVRLSSFAAV